jgi:hypothetical protein
MESAKNFPCGEGGVSTQNPVNECNREWLLKNSFQGISRAKFVRKLLNIRSPQARKLAEITALVPFSSATGCYDNYPHIQLSAGSGWDSFPACRQSAHNR